MATCACKEGTHRSGRQHRTETSPFGISLRFEVLTLICRAWLLVRNCSEETRGKKEASAGLSSKVRVLNVPICVAVEEACVLNTTVAFRARPMICIPKGSRVKLKPHGTLIAGSTDKLENLSGAPRSRWNLSPHLETSGSRARRGCATVGRAADTSTLYQLKIFRQRVAAV
jgi:hypothetical protein